MSMCEIGNSIANFTDSSYQAATSRNHIKTGESVAMCSGHSLLVSVDKLGKLKEETDLLIDQIRTRSNRRFMGDKPIAELSWVQMKRVEEAWKILLGE